MRSRSVTLGVVLTALAMGAGGYAHLRSQQLKTDARWLLERGSAQGEEYATSLDNRVAEEQLSTLDQRRAALDGVALWQRVELLAILCTVVGAASTYVLFLFRRLREQLVDANAPLEEPAAAGPRVR